jgi:MFS transporter, ACS family, solute carrier family 17 (sodium-dependent inorganic phosphate cotransporter), other
MHSTHVMDTTPFWQRRRYFVVMMAFFGLFNVYALRVNLSVAIVAMTENRTVEHSDGTVTYEQYFSWNSKEKGYILSSFFYGYLMTQVKSFSSYSINLLYLALWFNLNRS